MSAFYDQVRSRVWGYENIHSLSVDEIDSLSRSEKTGDQQWWSSFGEEMLPPLGNFWWSSLVKILDTSAVITILQRNDVPVGAFLFHVDPQVDRDNLVLSKKGNNGVITPFPIHLIGDSEWRYHCLGDCYRTLPDIVTTSDNCFVSNDYTDYCVVCRK